MQTHEMTRLAAAAAAAVAAGAAAPAADAPKVDPAALDKAFEALKTYDWGADRSALNPIDAPAACCPAPSTKTMLCASLWIAADPSP